MSLPVIMLAAALAASASARFFSSSLRIKRKNRKLLASGLMHSDVLYGKYLIVIVEKFFYVN